MRRGDLSNAEWVRLKPHLPKSGRRGGHWVSHRRIINGILYRQRTGVPWRDLPTRFGPWKTVYERHRRWSADGTWDKVFAAILADADAEGRIDWSMVSVDSTSCRAHQHAAGARRTAPRVQGKGARARPRQHRPDEGLGRSRGGLTCKIHLAGEGGRRPLAMLITPGQWGDAPQLIPVMERIRVSPWAAGIRAPGPTTSAAIERTRPAASVATCDDARSSTPSPNRRTSGPTASAGAAGAAGPLASTRRSTSAGTKLSERSTR